MVAISVALDYEFLPSAGHVTVLFAPPGSFVKPEAATISELNGLLNMSVSVSWNDFDFGVQASNTNNDPSLADVGNVETRGAAQFGGNISFYYPREYDDNSSNHSLVFDAIGEPRTRGYIVIRIDGDKRTSLAFADGDYYHVFEVLTDGETNQITGEEAFRYTINFLQQGTLGVYRVALTSTTATVVATPSSDTLSIGEMVRLNATVQGREYTNGVSWTTSNSAVATVSSIGVVKGISAGSATITATYEPTGDTDTVSITVSP